MSPFFKINLQWLNRILILLYLIFLAFESPIKYTLNIVGLVQLAYMIKGLIVVLMLVCIFKLIYDLRFKTFFVFEVLFLFFSCGVALMNDIPGKQIVITIYLLIPFIFGQTISKDLMHDKLFINYFKWIVLISILGVIIDIFIDFPWKGFEYEIGDYRVSGNKQWGYLEIDRITGFARSSVAAAFIILTSSILLYRKLPNLFFFILWMFAGIAIIFTTTKGAVFAYLVVSIAFVSSTYKKQFIKLAYPFFILIGILIPLSTFFINYNFNYPNIIYQFLFRSFEMRLQDTWPDSLGILKSPLEYIFGSGIGSIGSSLKYMQGKKLLLGDNLHVYLYVQYGIPYLILLLYFSYRFIKKLNEESISINYALIILFFAVNSMTTDIIESGILALFIGYFSRYIFSDTSNNLKNENINPY